MGQGTGPLRVWAEPMTKSSSCSGNQSEFKHLTDNYILWNFCVRVMKCKNYSKNYRLVYRKRHRVERYLPTSSLLIFRCAGGCPASIL